MFNMKDKIMFMSTVLQIIFIFLNIIFFSLLIHFICWTIIKQQSNITATDAIDPNANKTEISHQGPNHRARDLTTGPWERSGHSKKPLRLAAPAGLPWRPRLAELQQ